MAGNTQCGHALASLAISKADNVYSELMARFASVWQLAKPVLFGALTACAPLFAYDLLVSVAINGAWLICLYVTAIAFSAAVVIILAASVLIGLPATALLQQRRVESGRTYSGLGASVGAAIALALVPIWLGFNGIGGAYAIFIPLSAASGAVTAWTWWRRREGPLQHPRDR